MLGLSDERPYRLMQTAGTESAGHHGSNLVPNDVPDPADLTPANPIERDATSAERHAKPSVWAPS